MSFPRYPKYKASGVEWLGEVPVGWGVVQYKQFVDIQNGTDHKHVEQPEGYPVFGSGGVFAYASEFLYDGESVLLGRKGTIDKPLYVTGRFWTVDTMYWTKIRPNTSGRFVYYLATTIPFDYYSTNTALPSMTKGALSRHLVPLPPLPEQTAIAEFLDRETGKIDELVAEQRRLMELLKEKRQAVISHAVTKGLNPHAPMKPSGIEWLGDVPTGWEVLAMRRRAKRIQTGGTPPTAEQSYYEDGTVPWFGPGSFNDNVVVSEPIKWLNDSAVKDGTARVFAAGATMIVTIGATLGKVSSLADEGSCNQQITVIEFDQRRVCPRFATYQIKRLEPALRAIAPSATLPILGLGEIAALSMVIPPLSEQVAIVEHLDTELAKFDTLTAEAQRAIDLLQERRTALISAAVTGQIDVRGVGGRKLD